MATSIKLSLSRLPPLAIAGYRFFIALFVIIVFTKLNKIKIGINNKNELLHLILLGLIFTLQIGIINIGTKYTSAIHSTVFLSSYPLFVAIIAHFFLSHDKLNFYKISGLTLSFFGVFIIFLEKWSVNSPNSFIGDFLCIFSAFLLGVLYVETKFLVEIMDPTKTLVWQMIVGIPIFLILSFIFEGFNKYNISLLVFSGILYQALIIGFFCFVTQMYLIKKYSASKITSIYFTTPIFGVFIGHFILKESISSNIWIGVPFVIVGIYLVNK